ncbi:MAG: radical protein [Rhodospirillales bacterium]|nr:radical protein [Rhodospirillales bacterium]
MPTLEITTMIGCPLMCTFCPQTGLNSAYEKDKSGSDRAQKYLSLGNFKLMLDKVPKHLRIDFSGMAEPWANPQCTEMLRYTLESGFTVAVYTTLYGITEDDADIVVGLLEKHSRQIDVLCLHLPDANGNMRGWKPSQEWENVFCKFRRLESEKRIARIEIMTMDGSGRVHEALAHLNIKIGGWIGQTRAGSLDVAKQEIKGKVSYLETPQHSAALSCAMTPFYDHNVLLPNGDVALCCMDYDLKHVIGNLLAQDYHDLFKGEQMHDLRRVNMTPEFSKCSICKSCDRAMTFAITNDGRWNWAWPRERFLPRMIKRLKSLARGEAA